jgi:fused signal recognition particle receptor
MNAMNIVEIVIAIAVVAVGAYVFLLRGKGDAAPQLQAPPKKESAPAPAIKSERPAAAPPRAEETAPKPVAKSLDAPVAVPDIAPVAAPPTPVVTSERPPAATPSAPPSAASSRKEIANIRRGLAATRGGFIARLTAIFGGKKEIDPAILEQIEDVMLTSDVGVKTTQSILARLREGLDKNELRDSDAVWAALRAEATRILTVEGPAAGGGKLRMSAKPTVVLMVGVNGVGKTTSIGKLATRFNADGKSVVLAAGDTFRAAAVQQLEVWGKRVGAEVVKGKEGSDPSAVAFDATSRAKESGADLLLVDTAGRLHTKAPLMDEIKKLRKTIAKAMDGAPHETLLVLDATTGQNALTQAAMFKEAVDLTGIVLTKLDGTAKGGIVLGICDELKVPVRYIGLGERAEDLREFQADEFVEALFGRGGEDAAATDAHGDTSNDSSRDARA